MAFPTWFDFILKQVANGFCRQCVNWLNHVPRRRDGIDVKNWDKMLMVHLSQTDASELMKINGEIVSYHNYLFEKFAVIVFYVWKFQVSKLGLVKIYKNMKVFTSISMKYIVSRFIVLTTDEQIIRALSVWICIDSSLLFYFFMY